MEGMAPRHVITSGNISRGGDDQSACGAEGVDVARAAGLPVAFGTAHLALTERARLQAGQTLLVLGAGGGVGIAAVQVRPLHLPVSFVHM